MCGHRIRTLLLAALVVAATARDGFGQHVSHVGEFELLQWTTEHGLPSNVVRDVVADRDGVIWLRFLASVARFDGARFEHFLPRDMPGVHARRLSALLKHADGTVCAVAQDGRTYKWVDGQPRQVGDACAERVEHALEDAQGTIWLGGNSGLVQVGGERFPTRRVRSLYDDEAGTLWIVGTGGVHTVRSGKLERVSAIRDHVTHVGYAATDGPLAYGRDALYFLGGDPVRTVPLPAGAIRPWGVVGSRVDEWGDLWLASERGIYRVPGAKFSTGQEVELVVPAETTGPVRAVTRDTSGATWFCSETRGLFRLRRTPARRLGWPADSGSALLASARGGGLLVKLRNELFRIDGGVQKLADVGNAILSPARSGGAWIATRDRTYRFDGGAREPLALPESCRGRQWAREDARGRLWFCRFDLARGPIRLIVPGRQPTELHGRWLGSNPDGSVWIETQIGRVMRYADAPVETIELGDENFSRVDGCIEDRKGRVWITTKRNGLWCRVDGQFHCLNTEHGIPSDDLSTCLLDDAGRLWINSGQGIFVLETDQAARVAKGETPRLSVVRVTRTEHGMARTHVAPDGKLYFLSIDGWFEIDPARFERPAVPRPPRIVSVTGGGHRHDARKPIRLEPDARELRVEFASNAHGVPTDLRYAYRLSPLDRRWHELEGARTVSYAWLPPGDYRFEVRASRTGSEWSENSEPLIVEVVPALHEAMWFRVLAFLLASIALFLGFRARLRALRRHNQRLRDEVKARRAAEAESRRLGRRALRAQDDERRRIAKELHDDIGQRFALLVLRIQSAGEPEERKQVVNYAREMGRDVQRLSHLLHPAWIEAVGIEAALRTLVESVSEHSDVVVQFDDGGCDCVSGATTVAVYRIAQEALSNAVRHANATEITISAHCGKMFELRIRDNGCGFDSENAGPGMGLSGMVERAHELDSELTVTSAPGQGTTVLLRLAHVCHETAEDERTGN